MRRGAVVAGVLVVLVVVGAVLAVADATGGDEKLISRPWTRAELTDGGRQLTVWVEPPGDPTCEIFERLDVDRDGRTAFVRALYRRTDQKFCNVPCPLMDEARTVTLDEPLEGFRLAHATGAVDSCRVEQ